QEGGFTIEELEEHAASVQAGKPRERWALVLKVANKLDALRHQQAQQATPEVSVTAGAGVTEGGNASFTIGASPAPTSPLSVTVTVTQTGDYAASGATGTQTVTIPTGGSVSHTVPTVNDDADETDGSVTVTVNAGQGYTVSTTNGAATATVSDNDLPEISVTGGAGVTEGGNASFTIGASPAPTSPLSVTVTVTQTGDYAASGATGTQTVTIPTGGSVSHTVPTVNDDADETDGSVTVTVNAGQGYTVSTTNGAATATVSDNDAANVQDDDAAQQSCVTTDADLLAQVEAKTRDPWNGARPDLVETFTRSHNTMKGTDTYTVADIKARPDRQDPNWQGDGPNELWQKTYKELDRLEACRASASAQTNDPPPATPEVSVTAGAGVTEGGSASFTITASPAPASPLTVTLTVTQTGDYGASTGSTTVIIPTGGSVSHTVATVNDDADETDGTVTLTLNAGQGYTISPGQGTATVTVADDDATTVTLAADADAPIAEDGGVREITLTLNRALAPGESLTAPLDISGADAGSHYTLTLKEGDGVNEQVTLLEEDPHSAQQPAVVFAAGAQEATLLLTATRNDDAEELTVRVAFAAGERAPSGQNLSGGVTAEGDPLDVAIANDDEPAATDAPAITIHDAETTEKHPYLNSNTLRFSITLNEAPTEMAVVTYTTRAVTAKENVDYQKVTWRVAFRPGVTSAAAYITILDDNKKEDNETFQVVITDAGGLAIARGTATGTITDDD
ncbi:MAG: hypothetical protein OXG37_03610, partial [Actinomycetia bacterium]|nr:hypothetical protein [Actinomycetes bacterium]